MTEEGGREKGKRLMAAPTADGASKLYEAITGKKATPEERADVEAMFKAKMAAGRRRLSVEALPAAAAGWAPSMCYHAHPCAIYTVKHP